MNPSRGLSSEVTPGNDSQLTHRLDIFIDLCYNRCKPTELVSFGMSKMFKARRTTRPKRHRSNSPIGSLRTGPKIHHRKEVNMNVLDSAQLRPATGRNPIYGRIWQLPLKPDLGSLEWIQQEPCAMLRRLRRLQVRVRPRGRQTQA